MYQKKMSTAHTYQKVGTMYKDENGRLTLRTHNHDGSESVLHINHMTLSTKADSK